MMDRIRAFRPARRAVPVLFLAVFGVAGCSDAIGLPTNFTIADQAYTVFALSGSDLNAPTGMLFSTRTVVRVDGTFQFDIAFDINKDGNAVILPVNQVGTPVGGAPLIGLQRTSQAYADITEAPRSGYQFDSSMVVRPTAALIIQAQNITCSGFLTPYIFAKITVDSVNVPARTIYGHTLINTNCGSRQLKPGVPKF
jgi:hypothetical protein